MSGPIQAYGLFGQIAGGAERIADDDVQRCDIETAARLRCGQQPARLDHDALEWARRRGLRSLYLLTTTAGDYFPRFGFAPVARESAPTAVQGSREFSQACPSTALFMALPLNGESPQ